MSEKDEVVIEFITDLNQDMKAQKGILNSPSFFFISKILPIIFFLFLLGIEIWSSIVLDIGWGYIVYYSLLLIFMVFIIFILPKLTSKKRNEKMLTFQKILSPESVSAKITVDNEGVRGDYKTRFFDLKWSYIRKVEERKEFIYIRLWILAYYVIPKEYLNTEQLEMIHSILHKHLAKKQLKLQKLKGVLNG